jgi:hypothetical protein
VVERGPDEVGILVQGHMANGKDKKKKKKTHKKSESLSQKE